MLVDGVAGPGAECSTALLGSSLRKPRRAGYVPTSRAQWGVFLDPMFDDQPWSASSLGPGVSPTAAIPTREQGEVETWA